MRDRILTLLRVRLSALRQQLRLFISGDGLEQGFIVAEPHPYGPIRMTYEEWRTKLPSEARRLPARLMQWRLMCAGVASIIGLVLTLLIWQFNVVLAVMIGVLIIPAPGLLGYLIAPRFAPWDAQPTWFGIRNDDHIEAIQVLPWGALAHREQDAPGLASASFVRYLQRQEDSKGLLTQVTHQFTSFDMGITIGMAAVWVIGIVLLVVIGADTPPGPPPPPMPDMPTLTPTATPIPTPTPRGGF